MVLDTSPRVSSNIPSERCARCSPICTFSTGQISRRRGFDPSFLSKRREVFIPLPQAFQFMIFRKSDFISTFKFKRSSNRIAEGKRNFSSKNVLISMQHSRRFATPFRKFSHNFFAPRPPKCKPCKIFHRKRADHSAFPPHPSRLVTAVPPSSPGRGGNLIRPSK